MRVQPHVPHVPRSRGVLVARNRVAALCRFGAAPAVIEEARAQLRYEMAAAQVARWSDDEQLTVEQRARLATLLHPGAGGGHVAA